MERQQNIDLLVMRATDIRGEAVAVAISSVWMAALWQLSSWSFVFNGPQVQMHDTAAMQRRGAVAGLLAAALAPASSFAAELPGLGKMRGPFEMDPKDAVIVGDTETNKMKNARAKVEALLKEAEGALAAVDKDMQTDLMPMYSRFGIADLRDATNAINDIMDDSSAAGTQRLQRLMIQCKYALEDDIPFPQTKKGKVLPRGDERRDRIVKNLKDYVQYSQELLQYLA